MKQETLDEFRERVSQDNFAHLLGIEMDEVRKGYARASLLIENRFRNFSGYIHGGVIFSLADQAFAAASNSRGILSLGIEVSTSFISSARVGERLTAVARQVHSGRRISVYRIEVKSTSGRLVAICRGTVYQKTRKEIPSQ